MYTYAYIGRRSFSVLRVGSLGFRYLRQVWFRSGLREVPDIRDYLSYSRNSLKGGYIGDYIGDYYRGY